MGKKVWLKLLMVGVVAVCVCIVFLIASKDTCACSPAANESSAVGSLRSLYLANLAYAKDHPAEGYPQHLNDVAPQLVPGDGLAVGEKSGYRFSYSVSGLERGRRYEAYEISADPDVPGKTGNRHFFMDETGIVRVSTTGPANASDSALH